MSSETTAVSDGLEAVLAAHLSGMDPRGHTATCSCGWTDGVMHLGAVWGRITSHNAHLADAIRAAGWRKAPQEACAAGCGDGGGAGGCGDQGCDDEHGGEQTPNVIVRRVEPELVRIEVSMPAWVTPTRHGICGDRSQGLIMTNGLIDVATCELTAGHLGMHSSGDGRHWIHSDMTTAATEGDTE